MIRALEKNRGRRGAPWPPVPRSKDRLEELGLSDIDEDFLYDHPELLDGFPPVAEGSESEVSHGTID